jgi:putative acetyltransferase
VRLETGSLQAAAIELYRAAGYRRIPVYGRMAHDPRCVCFEKLL